MTMQASIIYLCRANNEFLTLLNNRKWVRSLDRGPPSRPEPEPEPEHADLT